MEQLEFSREKPKSHAIVFRGLYAINRFLIMITGLRRTLRFTLTLIWFLNRVAFENSVKSFGNTFLSQVTAIDDKFLIDACAGCKSAIDIGCGTGRQTEALLTMGLSVVAIDTNENSLEELRRRVEENPKLKIVNSKVEDYMISRREFDVALCSHVLEHIENPIALIKLLRTSCSRLVLEVPNFHADTFNPIRLNLSLPFYSDADHLREYSLETTLATLSEGGWTVRNIQVRGGGIAIYADS